VIDQIGDGNAEKGDAIGKIGGAVDGVDDPQAIYARMPHPALFFGGHLFAEHRCREESGQAIHEGGLGCQIGFGQHAAVGLLFAHGTQIAGQDGLAGHLADHFCQGAGVFEALGAGHRLLGRWRLPLLRQTRAGLNYGREHRRKRVRPAFQSR
jgi:hypothetical protein